MPEERLSMRLDPLTRHWLLELMRVAQLGQSDAVRLAVHEAARKRRARPYAPKSTTETSQTSPNARPI